MKKLINVYLYSHLHIALCTVFLYRFTMESIGLDPKLPYSGLLMSGSVFLYSLHRLIGIDYFYMMEDTYRFNFYRKNKRLLYTTLILSGLLAVFSLWYVSHKLVIGMMPGIILGGLYAIPIFNGKRLRDAPYVKIFLIAITWTYLTIVLPLSPTGISSALIILLCVERCFFFLAITLPFDIRDMEIDAHQGVGTIPLLLGKKKSVLLSLLFLVVGLIAILISWKVGYIDHSVFMIWIGTYILTGMLIVNSTNRDDDLYFTGFLDGTMMLPYILYMVFHYV